MSDQARSVLSDPRAPASERFDAEGELQKSHSPLRSALIPRSDLMPIINMIRDDLEDQFIMAKAKGAAMQLGSNEHTLRDPNERGMKSVYLDKLGITVTGQYYEKPTQLSFDGLRQMVEQTPVLKAVVMTRVRQISRFAQVSEDGGPGFEIRHVSRKHKLTDEERLSTELLSSFIANCGWEFNPRKRKAMGRNSFSQFLAKSATDSLTMDAAPIEVEMKRNRNLGIDGFYAIDGSTVRLCTEEGYNGDDTITGLQVVQGRITTAYTNDSLIYEVRNPRTDVRLAGYGQGEPELLVKVVTGFLNAMAYNNAGFDQNTIPKGLLQLTGEYSAEDLAAFKRYWAQTVKGVNNAWNLPVMVSSEANAKATFEKFGVEFSDVMFAKWMTLLVSIICAIYGMSPDEINFESFAAAKSTLSGSDTEEKLANSKDSGLHPFMAYYEAMLTDFVVAEFDPKFCFRWTGVKPEDEARQWEAKKLILTVDEVRAEQGYGPHPDAKVGALPVNPSLIGPAMQLNQPPAPGGDFGGGPGEEKPDFGNPDEGGAGGDDAGGDDAGGDDGGEDANGQPPPPGPSGGDDAGGGGGDFGSGGGGGDFGKALQIYSLGA